MDNNTLRKIAQQHRQPHGEHGIEVAERMNVSNELMNRWAIEELTIQPNDRILEIGPGNGLFVPSIINSATSVTYTGYDHAELMVNQARHLNSLLVETGQARFVLRDGPTMPFADNSFSRAFAVNVIYFWENPITELAELHRVLDSSGILELVFRPRSIMVNIPYVAYGFQTFESEDVHKLLEANHFEVMSTSTKDEPPQQINGQMLSLVTVLVTSRPV
jgi:ubiquinone/menaquinone biosynthesis C-methylase UbiE